MNPLTSSKLKYYFFAIILIGILYFLLQNIFHLEAKDIKKYQHIMREVSEKQSSQKEFYSSKQERTNTEKNIWYIQNDQRLHFYITSKHSFLIFSSEEKASNLFEKMDMVTCMMQEELFYQLPNQEEVIKNGNNFYTRKGLRPLDKEEISSLRPMQKLRIIKANTATYSYTTHQFVANKVHINRYITQGHLLIKSGSASQLLMEGTASNIEFSLVGNNLNFKAKHLKAKFLNPLREF